MTGEKRRVLVVDDEPSVVLLCKDVLQDAGYHVEAATEAEQASALIRSAPYDVFLIDVGMVDMGGLEVLRTARETSPRTPVVVMTAAPEHLVPRRAGLNAYLHKPFSRLEALEQAVATALQQASAPP